MKKQAKTRILSPKNIAVSFPAMLLAAIAPGPVFGSAEYDAEDYFPLAENASWTWEIDPNNAEPYTVEEVAEGTEEFHGTTTRLLRIDDVTPPDVSVTSERSRWMSNDSGIRLHHMVLDNDRTITRQYEEPLQLLPAGFDAGETYEYSSDLTITLDDSDETDATETLTVLVAGEESITVPAGTFDAVRLDVTEEIDVDGQPPSSQSYSLWLASGIGFVMQSFDQGEWLLVESSAGESSPPPEVEIDMADYTPIIVGASWEYRMLGHEGGDEGDLTEEIVEEDTDGFFRREIVSNLDSEGETQQGTAAAREKFTEEGHVVASLEFEQAMGDTVVMSTSRDYGDPIDNFTSISTGETRIIAFPFTEESVYFDEEPIHRSGVEEVAVTFEAVEEITVPAGTFETVRLQITTTTTYDDDPENPEVENEVHWRAEGIGRVRTEFSDRVGDSEEPHHYDILLDHTVPDEPVEPGESFADWAANHGLSDGEDGPEGNPSGDGIANAIKYALGLDPNEPATEGLPEKSFETVDDERYLALEIPRNPNAEDADFIIEVSGDLGAWQNGDETIEVIEETDSLLRVRDTQPVSEAQQRFMRVRIELNEG